MSTNTTKRTRESIQDEILEPEASLQGIPQGREHDEDREAVNDRITELNDALDELEAKPKSATHTPGPWHIYYDDCPIINAYDEKIGLKSDIAAICRDDVTQDEVQANARLIAAAPELLEALREAREAARQLENMFAEGLSDDDCRELSRMHSKARAAIARAEGAEPEQDTDHATRLENYQTPIKTKEQARAFIELLFENGHSFHLDESPEDITDGAGRPIFTAPEAKAIAERQDELFKLLDDPHELMWEVMESREGESINQD
jgi:hypothetical protein